MANYSRWEDITKRKGEPPADVRAGVEQDLALGQLIYDLRTEAGLSQRELAERMGTTQSVISRLEEGGGARNRIDTLARVAKALDRHLIVSFPAEVPDQLTDAVAGWRDPRLITCARQDRGHQSGINAPAAVRQLVRQSQPSVHVSPGQAPLHSGSTPPCSGVGYRAHNPKVAGSNPAPATNQSTRSEPIHQGSALLPFLGTERANGQQSGNNHDAEPPRRRTASTRLAKGGCCRLTLARDEVGVGRQDRVWRVTEGGRPHQRGVLVAPKTSASTNSPGPSATGLCMHCGERCRRAVRGRAARTVR